MVYHIGTCLILSLNKSDIIGVNSGNKQYYNTGDFYIKRYSSFALDHKGLYLPGNSDFMHPLPRSEVFNLSNKELFLRWLEQYKIAYKTVNGIEPIIIDLECIMETEEIPEMKLG